jgi:hypothetical protein
MINAMNTSAIEIGFLRRGIAVAVLATAITATAVGLASTAHADDDAPAPAPAPALEAPIAVPAPIAPWLPRINSYYGGYGRLHCGFPGWQGPFQCWY